MGYILFEALINGVCLTEGRIDIKPEKNGPTLPDSRNCNDRFIIRTLQDVLTLQRLLTKSDYNTHCVSNKSKSLYLGPRISRHTEHALIRINHSLRSLC